MVGSMTGRRRSWLIAVVVAALGLLLFTYDDLLGHNDLDGTTLHQVAMLVEFLILGPGMGVLAFVLSEYLRLDQERLRLERARAHEARLVFLGRIAASIAHEVRNPLHNLRLLLEEPCRTHGDPVLAARVGENLERINRAVEMVYQLASPRDHDGDDEVGCDLVPLVREAVTGLPREHPNPPTIATMPDQALTTAPAIVVRMVVDNLLRNALAAGDRIVIAVARNGTSWTISVRNPGRLPPEILREAGNDDPDDAVALPAHTSATGLGLGLFISRHLVRRVDGRLRLEQHGDEVVAILSLPVWNGAATPSSDPR